MIRHIAPVPLRRTLIVLLFALNLAPALTGSAQQGGRDSVFARANAAFEKGDYAGAEKQYRSLVEAGNASEQLFFNLGNAVYRQERHGEAALWFQRALVLDPRMTEAHQNLRVLKHRTGYLEFESEGIDVFLKQLAEGEVVSVLTAGLWTALLLAAALLVFRRTRAWRPFLLIVIALAVAAAVFSAWCLKRQRAEFAIEGRAIVVDPEAKAVTGPVPDAEKVVELPPGSEVRIVLDRGAWTYVDIPGAVRGWVRTEMIEPVAIPPK